MTQPEYGTPPGPAGPGGGNGEYSLEERLRNQAVRNLRRRAAFKMHLLIYALVNLLLVVIWLVTGLNTGVWYPWFVFPLFGWGIGVASNGWAVYRGDVLSEERIRAEMNRLAGR
jgi:2TM domain